MNTMADDTYKIFVGKSHQSPPGGRIGKLAPMGYGLQVVGPSIDEKHWGYGSERSTEVMFALGLIRGVEIVLIERDDPIIEVISTKLGTKDYMDSHVWGWLQETGQGIAGESKDSFSTWKRLLELHELGRLKWRNPEAHEVKLLNDVQNVAKRAAIKAREKWQQIPAGFTGVYAMDETGSRP